MGPLLKITVEVAPDTGAAAVVVGFDGIELDVRIGRSAIGVYAVSGARITGDFAANEEAVQDLVNAAGGILADLGAAMGRAHLFKSPD